MPSSAKPKPGWPLLTGSATQSPSFQPPSYYAAANGIPYPRTPRPDPSSLSSPNASELIDTTHYQRFMPISYLPDPSSSDSSIEYRPTKPHTTTGSSTSRSTNRAKRQSQIAGLPQIEAQLLPSLRDTIDRMTRPPSRLAPPVAITTENDAPYVNSHGQRHEHGNLQSDFLSNGYDPNMLQKRPRRALSPQSLYPHDRNYSKASPNTTPTPSSAERMQRSLANKDRHHDSPWPDASPKKSSTGTPTLRSVKSLLARKLSTNSTTTVSSQASPKKPILKDAPQPPKSMPNSSGSAFSPRKQQQTPIVVSRSTPPPKCPPDNKHAPERPALRQPSQPHKSNIPRLRARFALDPMHSQNSDASDVERRYESARVEQRRLTVINAPEPVTSSSDSDSDSYVHPATPTRLPPGVGLGLNCHFPSHRSPCPETAGVDSYSESDNSIHQTPRSSVTSFQSSNSQYSTGSDNRGLLLGNKMGEEMQRQGQSLNLVSILNGKPQRYTIQGGTHFGEQDVTLSASSELEHIPRKFTASGSGHPIGTQISTSGVPTSPIRSTLQGFARRSSPYMPSSLPLSSPGTPHIARRDENSKKTKGTIGSTIARLARRSFMVATREREAFGLGPSDSQDFHQRFEDFHLDQHGDNRLSRSSVGDAIVAPDDALSHGASYLLQSVKARQQPSSRDAPTPVDGGASSEESISDMKHRSSSTTKAFPTPPPQSNNGTMNETPPPLPSILLQLLESEETFVASMRMCIQLYVLPLRVQGSKAWISGVPSQASLFLDWFEDILHLHEQILTIFRGSQEHILGDMIHFLPKFEIYQPYFVNLGDFSQQLGRWIDEGNDFGHFVVLQDKQVQHSGWSLLRYISEPEKRLQKYFDLISALLELTHRQAPQFLIIFSLLQVLGLIIDVLNTVKQEEEEHRTLSSFLRRFRCPDLTAYLADRKRTLRWHGSVILKFNEEPALHNHDAPQTAHKTRRLSKAITAWDMHHDEPNFYNHGFRDSLASSDAASNYSSSTSGFQDDSSLLQADLGSSTVVYAAVLSDIILFGERSPDSSDSYDLISNIGMSRVFSVQNSGSSSAFLEVIPIDTIDSSPVDLPCCIKGVIVSLSPPALDTSSGRDSYQDMFSALQNSADYTKQRWCRPWKVVEAAAGNDTLRILDSLVGSGLPLPKSPSGRLPELSPYEGDASIQEREERGWWAFRFHQVMAAKRQMVSHAS